MNIFKSLFGKKKEKQPPAQNINFYGVIVTKEKVGPYGTEIPLSSLYDKLYQDIKYIYTDWNKLREFIAVNCVKDELMWMNPMYFYEVVIRPKLSGTVDRMKDTCDTSCAFSINELDKESIDIVIVRKLPDRFIEGIRPGIHNMADFNHALAIGYKALLMQKILPEYSVKLQEAGFEEKAVDAIFKDNDLAYILPTVDNFYKHTENWKEELKTAIFHTIIELHK